MASSEQAALRTKGDMLLEIRNLRVEGRAGGRWLPLVKDVSLRLKRGEVLGLVGESGAGKSTLGLAAMGYARPGCRIAAGAVRFDGIDLTQAGERDKQRLRGTRIAYVAQSAAAAFNPAHRIIDQTVETATLSNRRLRHEAVARAQQLYKRLRLPDFGSFGARYPHQASGGQLQRAMTAMAMSCRPDLIVFDEPTTALDVTTQVEVLAAIRDIVEEFRTAAIYISHDLAVVAQMAHRIVVLRYGEIVEEAPTRDILNSPKADYTRSLWAVRKLEKLERSTAADLLRVEGVDAGYANGGKVLNDVSIRVPRGHTVAVVGESGSGKSTLARVITGLLEPSRGRVVFAGEPLPARAARRDRESLRRIQFVYQSADTALNPRHTVRELIGRPLELYFGMRGEARERRVLDLLDRIEMNGSHIDRRPGELSGGQKQRIAIARALAAEPDLVICDEVTSSLDQIVQEEILKLLLALQKELGTSYLYITHDISTVRATADEVVVMHRGRVVEQGAKSEVLAPPYPPYTELLLSSVPQMDPDWLSDLLRARDRDGQAGPPPPQGRETPKLRAPL